ncbi:MAG: hypothetical protein FAF04_00160 [Epsilonproteobacteria bacterium]|nr:hypothetical protein [Campylobacterota bacterium]
MKRAISIFLAAQLLIFISYFISVKIFANVETAFISAFLIILGASYAYKKMIMAKVAAGEYVEDRDLLEKIEDPHGLYEGEINDAPTEELNLKEIVKEEKAKVKPLNVKNIKHGIKGSLSLFRLLPYLVLILGFIALKNNNILELWYYLPSLFFGIIVGAFVSREILA